MFIPAVVTAFVHWLRSGYPQDAPRYGHSPLLALMDQRLSPAQISEIVIALDWEPATEAIDKLHSTAASHERVLVVEAADRSGLLRDISEVFAREKINVTGVKTQSIRDRNGPSAHMTFTVETPDAGLLPRVLGNLKSVKGVRNARRR